MKRDVLGALAVAVGVLLCGTIPGLVLGAPMAVFGAFWLIEPRIQSDGMPDSLRRLGRLG